VIAVMDRRRALIWLITAGLIVLACLPAVIVFGLGWLSLPHIQPWGAPPARDATSIEAWALFAVFYLVWAIGLMLLLIWSFDRVGHHWHYYEGTPRPRKKDRRRTRATMQQVNAEQQATIQAMRRREERDARRRRDRERDEARRRGPGGGAGGGR
jgi:hypothetical protein